MIHFQIFKVTEMKELHVKEQLNIFFYHIKEMSEFCKSAALKILFTVCQDVRCNVNLVRNISATKLLKWTVQIQNYFFRKIVYLTK